jgi:uncharacterized protein (TIGR02996 family)
MASAEPLLQAIVDEPEDNALRLILADWLEDQGDPSSVARAELTRIQVELGRADLDVARRQEMTTRQAQILRARAEGWLGPLRKIVRRWEVNKGTFRVVMEADALAKRKTQALAEEWFARAWVQELCLTGYTRRWGPLFGLPQMERLHSLELDRNDFPMSGALDLAASTRLTRLSALTFDHNQIGEQGIRVLATSKALIGLRKLVFRNNLTRTNGASMRALLGGRHWPRLRSLGLISCLWGDAIEALASAPGLARLTALDLSDSYYRVVDALLGSPHISGLTSLRLQRCDLSDPGAALLAGAPALTGLRELDLSWNRIGPEGAQALAASPNLGGLTRLDMMANPHIDEPGWRALRARFGPALVAPAGR